jgi:hypothetical protein
MNFVGEVSSFRIPAFLCLCVSHVVLMSSTAQLLETWICSDRMMPARCPSGGHKKEVFYHVWTLFLLFLSAAILVILVGASGTVEI